MKAISNRLRKLEERLVPRQRIDRSILEKILESRRRLCEKEGWPYPEPPRFRESVDTSGMTLVEQIVHARVRRMAEIEQEELEQKKLEQEEQDSRQTTGGE